VLAFLGQEVVGDAKKAFDGDSDADFFESFTERTVVESFEVFELAADDAPAACFGCTLAEREERAATVVEDEHTYADSWKEIRYAVIILRSHSARGRGRPPRRTPLQIQSAEAR
jgi:hypothetical protein